MNVLGRILESDQCIAMSDVSMHEEMIINNIGLTMNDDFTIKIY